MSVSAMLGRPYTLRECDYLADPAIASAVFRADRLEKPLPVEEPAGVGETELANRFESKPGTTHPLKPRRPSTEATSA